VIRNATILCALLLLTGCSTQQVAPSRCDQSTLLDVFPKSVAQVPASEQGQTIIASTYTPSGSLWAEGLDETRVFQTEIRHQQEHDNSFALRIGKGGQIYSLRGAFGESIPPSRTRSPWNDEVWQFVSVCTRYNGLESLLNAGPVPKEVEQRFRNSPYAQLYFIHNSGAYIPGDSALKNIYCPLFGSEVADGGRTYRTINWGLVPQVKTINRSPVLYYCQTRDVGDGVIELTWVVHNFSVRDDIVFDHLNAPWGGTRISSLPLHYVSSPEGELKSRKDIIDGDAVDVRKSGGWNISCATENPDSPSLALVFGRDKHLEEQMRMAKEGNLSCQIAPSLYRDWVAHNLPIQDWKKRPENSWRNYDVAVVIPKFRLAPGLSIWYRSFLVVNRKDRAIELAKSLVDKVDYGLVTFDPASTPMLPVFIKDGKVLDAGKAGGTPAFELFSKPVPGTLPLFLIENTITGKEAITTDPYFFVTKEKLDFGVPKEHPNYDYYSHAVGYSMDKNNSSWKRLLGYGYVNKPANGSFKQVSEVLDSSLFPKADTYHVNLWVAQPFGNTANTEQQSRNQIPKSEYPTSPKGLISYSWISQ
jgi:hypothetical protein